MFTLLIDTLETGLGRLVFIARIGGFNEAQAILKFRSLFKQFDDPEAWDYYSIRLDVYDDAEKEQREKAQTILKNYLRKHFIESLFIDNINFSMAFNYNFS